MVALFEQVPFGETHRTTASGGTVVKFPHLVA
jgi:hypothetical protein